MKILCVVLIAVVLLASCTTVEGIESPKGLEIDEVKGSEVTQEEFEELFGKKDFYSYPDTIIEVNTIDPVVMDDNEIKDLAVEDIDITATIDEEPIEELSFVEETPFVFPVREGKEEWVSVPEIETIEYVESDVLPIVEESISDTPKPPTLFLLSQSAENEMIQEGVIDGMERQEELLEKEIEIISGDTETDIPPEVREVIPSIEDIFSGEEKVEPKSNWISNFFNSHLLLKAICVMLAALIVIAVIVYRIGEKKTAEYKERDEGKFGVEKEAQKEPEPPTLSNVGVPDKTEESTGMDILKGEERYSKLVERSLDNS